MTSATSCYGCSPTGDSNRGEKDGAEKRLRLAVGVLPHDAASFYGRGHAGSRSLQALTRWSHTTPRARAAIGVLACGASTLAPSFRSRDTLPWVVFAAIRYTGLAVCRLFR